ncbi:imidazole glycerol phosphate synthase subunit HisH [Candidatus Poribacteria bacterium]|nr:imidazole glycerol phosphate synthase subunit HisH [Candidatus Poribacteria bacterium]
MIAIVDYQMGNLRSVQKAFEYKGCEAVIVDDVRGIRDAEAIVLPGVGAFGDCYRELETRGFIDPLLKHISEGRPFLGICLGLQLLLTSSEESEGTSGLNVVPGHVKRFVDGELKVPHMGWNRVRYPAADRDNGRQCPLFEGIPDGTYFYFVHSYYVAPEDCSVVSGVTDYGVTFASAVWRGNMFATQFHPEKSQGAGLKLIENFGKVVKNAAHASV